MIPVEPKQRGARQHQYDVCQCPRRKVRRSRAQTTLKADTNGWLTHGGTYSEQRHSPLKAVNTGNVSELGLAWSYDLDSSRGIETTPIVHEGILYATSTYNVVHAMDARTGAPLWSDSAWSRTAHALGFRFQICVLCQSTKAPTHATLANPAPPARPGSAAQNWAR